MKMMSSSSNENDACFGTSYVKKRENNIDTFLCRPRRYKRAYDRAIETSRRHTFYEENFCDLPIYRSLGHRSIQQASFNKSAAKQCRIIKFQRQNTASLPNLFSSYSSNLNELDGLNPLCLKKTTTKSSSLLPLPQFDSFSNSLTLTTRKQRPPSSSSSPTFQKEDEPQSSRSNTLPKAVNSIFNSIRNYPLPQYFNNSKSEDMKALTKDKAATTTSGKPKKKRPSIFSFFSRKKRNDPKPHSTLDDNISHGGSELNFDDVVVPKETVISPPVKSKKTFRAPLPPPDDNKENVKDLSKKRLSNASVPSKFSRSQGSRRSSRRSSSRRKAATNSKTIKVEETKSVISNDSAPNDPPPPIPPPTAMEPRIDKNEEPLPSPSPPPPPMTHLNSNRLKTVIKTETIYSLKKAVEITPSSLETDVDKNLFKEKKKQQHSPVSVKKAEKSPTPKRVKNDEITTDMIFTSIPLPQPPPSPPKSSSSPKQTKPKQEREDLEIPPAIPQSAPPDPIAVATALSFTSTKQSTASSVKRLSNFGLSPAKVPPIPVSQFEDLTDSSSDSGNSTNIIMPVYTNVDLKHQLHIEHKKLLSLYEDWEMLRRPQYSSPNDGHTFANIMIKQEAVLRQHAIVTSLYNQLLAPVVSNNSSPASTLRLKPAPPRHIINPTNSNPPTLSRGYIPSLYKSRSTFDVMNGENNNIKKEPERNYQQAGNYSPRISQSKRYSAGDVLNPIRPRLGSTETSSENSNNHRYDERKKYVVEQKPVVRNVPILTSLPKLMNTNIIINTEPKRNVPQTRNNNNFSNYSPPVTKRELTPVNEKPIKQVENKKVNIEIRNPPPTLLNNVTPKTPSPLIEKKVTKYPPPPNYSPQLNHQKHQHYYANSPPTTKKQVITNGFQHSNHSPPIRQISLPEVIIQKQAAKPPTPIQTKKVIVTPKSPPTKSQPPSNNNGVHGDLMTSISAFPNVTLRSVPKPVEKSFNLGRVLENGERPSSYYREQEEELPSKPSTNGTGGPPAPPPPPPPPPPPSGAILKKSNVKPVSSPSKNSDADALRGDMLAEIRKAGGVQFLRSISTK